MTMAKTTPTSIHIYKGNDSINKGKKEKRRREGFSTDRLKSGAI
jgi:hypothetical protein